MVEKGKPISKGTSNVGGDVKSTVRTGDTKPSPQTPIKPSGKPGK